MFEIFVEGTPRAQPRPRFSKGRAYHERGPIDVWRRKVRDATRAFCDKATPLSGPLMVTMVFSMPRPKRLVWKSKPMPRLPHTSKPDCDNLAKGTLDAMTGVAWDDDSQVCVLAVQKWIAGGNDSPGVKISVNQVGEDASL